MRSGVPAQGVGDVYDAAAAPFALAAGGFLGSLAQVGVFDRMVGDAVQLPFYQRLGVASAPMTAAVVAEGRAIPVQALQLTDLGDGMMPLKTGGMCVVTDELAKIPSTTATIERELRLAVAVATDTKFLTALVAATTPIASSGSSAANTQTDFAALLNAVSLSAASKPLAVFHSAAVKKLLGKLNTGGDRVWPDLTWSGGIMSGVPVLVSDALPSGAAVLFDCTQIAANRGVAGLSASTQGDVELQTAPTQNSTSSTPAQLVSMWQNNLVGIKAERTFAYAFLRATALASLSGVAY